MKLSEFYMGLKNPIYDTENLGRIVETYSNSSNFSEDILKLNSNDDSSSINTRDRDSFYLHIYNLWVVSLNSFFRDDSDLSYRDKVRFNKLYWYINDHKPKCADDVLRLFDPSYVFDEDLKYVLNKFKWNYVDNDGFSHFDYNAISCGFREPVIPKHELYINIDNEASYLFLTHYVNECAKRRKRFYFKFNPNNSNDASCVIYADDENLLDTIKMINVVFSKDKSLLEHVSKPPVTCSKLSDYIGYGSEVDYDMYNDSVSYNDIRSYILSSNIDKTTREWIGDNLDTVVVSENRQVSYKKHFMSLVYLFKKVKLENEAYNNRHNNSYKFITLEDIKSKEFLNQFVSLFDSHYEEIKEAIVHNKPLSIDINVNGNIININNSDIDVVIRSQAINIYRVDDLFKRRLKNNIWEDCKRYAVDPSKFSCNRGVYADFLEMDAKNKTKLKK